MFDVGLNVGLIVGGLVGVLVGGLPEQISVAFGCRQHLSTFLLHSLVVATAALGAAM